ncbi:MAG: hypothetical protein KIH69_000795 [Anaerolineae bacterium]|nr:hypothetical protein [Anaerolineae bacterium]
MSKNTLKNLILILGFATALIHLYLNVRLGRFDVAFTLNGLGYLALLAAMFGNLSFTHGRSTLVHYVFMAFTAVTILAWFALSGNFGDSLAVVDKVIEVALIVCLWLHLKE